MGVVPSESSAGTPAPPEGGGCGGDLTVAHSPDSDDAFMFYALLHGRIDTGGLSFSQVLADIETLNRRAMQGVHPVTAISIHAYAYVSDRYALLGCGGSVGERYGPIVVARRPLPSLRGQRIAVPGFLTTAYLTLRLLEPDFAARVHPFDRIIDLVLEGEVDAGLLIHEGQLSYEDHGLKKVVDLGEWWHDHTGGMPLPLGGNAVRRDLGEDTVLQVARLLRESIRYALEHRDEAVRFASRYGRGLGLDRTDRFVGLYVNARTIDYGEDGRDAVRRLLDEGHERGIIAQRAELDFIG